ncbi:MAG: hypothetical protein ACRC7B_02575 [Metamycoplasmataceae bacterium]
MNKKLILLLGATPILTILPFAAMASCSTAIDIDTEIKKFNITVQTKNKDLLAYDSAKTIEDANTPENKLKALEVFANVPKISKGYELVVKSASVNATTKTTIDVLISIHETDKPEIKKDATFKVEGFKVDTLEIEAKRFEDPKQTNDTSLTVIEAIARVNDAVDQPAKLEALKTFVDVPNVSLGFGILIMEINPDPESTTSINVKISVYTNTTPARAIEVTFRILGLTA